MRTLLLAGFATAALYSVSAHAESAFCNTGSTVLMASSDDNSIQRVMSTCKPGDIISIPGNTVNHEYNGKPLIQLLCDFSKSFYIAPNGLLSCVMVPMRSER